MSEEMYIYRCCEYPDDYLEIEPLPWHYKKGVIISTILNDSEDVHIINLSHEDVSRLIDDLSKIIGKK